MDTAEIIERVKAEMPERRWRHTEGVMSTAIKLAERYGADSHLAELAAILHDVAKFWSTERLASVIRDNGLQAGVLDYNKELWHAPVGAWAAQEMFGVSSEDVLNAIRFHTAGRIGMSKLEKIVWLADYIEPGRNFPGVDQVRKLSEDCLEEAVLAGMDSTIGFLIEKGQIIYPPTIEARNDLLKQVNDIRQSQ